MAASDKTIAEVARDVGINDTTLAAAFFVKVFTRENGGMLRPDHVTATFRRLVRKADVPAIRQHDLRHTHASLALAAGVELKVVSDRLGHSTTAITADLYTHVMPAVGRAAIAASMPAATEHVLAHS